MKKRGTADKFPKAILYKDFRVMLEKQKDIDAVLVATPDHTHAVVAMAAMQLGKHVYVQKPLTRTISEARALTEAARKYKVVTQMGNQGHSEEGLRLMQEWLDAGAIGQVREVQCWTNRPIWPQGMPRPTETMAVPAGLDWDLWIGPTQMRAFHKTYHPFGWRAWQDFGAGAMGDMGCHVMDAAFTILKLGSPTSVVTSEAFNFLPPAPGQGGFGQRVAYNDSYPPASIIHMSFPARGNMPPVKLHWYDGGLLPERPEDLEPERKLPESGTIFIGDKGKMWCETYSESPAAHSGVGDDRVLRAPAEDVASRSRRPRRTRKELAGRDPAEGPGGLGLRLRRPVHRGGAARKRRPALPRHATDLGWTVDDDRQRARSQSVRAAHLSPGLVALAEQVTG